MSILVGAVVPVGENLDFDSDSNTLNFDSDLIPMTQPISMPKVARKTTTASVPTRIFFGFT